MNTRTKQGGAALALLIWAWIALTNGWTGTPTGVNAQGVSPAAHTVPHHVLYQGYVTHPVERFARVGYFKFAITDQSASVFYWSNDGTVGVPAVSVPINVLDGYFTVLLGDTSLSGMRQALDSGVFGAADRHLKVWFSTSLSGPFDALNPVPIAAAPYALNAETLDSLHANQIASTAAYTGGDQSLNLDLPDTVVRYVTVNALRSGRVIVHASGYGYLPVDTHYLRCSITTGTALDNSALSIARGASYVPFAQTRGYTVGAGTHRFNLVCDSNSDQVVVRDTNVTAIYVPGSFGALSAPDTSPAPAPVPDGCVDENGGQCEP